MYYLEIKFIMKKQKWLVGCIALLLFYSSCTSEGTNNSTPQENVTTRSMTSRDENEAKSIELHEKLNATFNASRSGESSYPDYYGGAYIGDNGEFIVLVKGNSGQAKKDLGNRLKSSNFQTQDCDYSYQELLDLNERLGTLFERSELRENLNWISVGMQVAKNRIIVYLRDTSEQAISRFKTQVSSSPMIIFDEMSSVSYDTDIETDTIISDTNRATVQTNIHMGATCSTSSTSAKYNASVGFRAMRGTAHGFITAAHFLPQTGITVNFGTVKCGTSTAVCKGPQADAAFVTVDYANFYPTNVTQWTKTVLLDDYISNASLPNVSVVAEGQTTQKAIKAKVTSINNIIEVKQTSVVGNVSFIVSNMVFAEFTVQSAVTKQGDSGCIIYGETAKKWAGILSGIGTSTSTGKINLLFSSAELALNALGASKSWVK